MNRLLTIQTRLKAPKSQFNDFGKYHYRNCEDILEALKPLLKETETALVLTDEVVLIGTRYYVKARVTLVGLDGKEIYQTVAYAREEETKKGMDGSQITGAASSYARKYAMNGLFAIDDTKDADSNGIHHVSTTAPATTDTTAAAPTPAPKGDEAHEVKAELGRLLMEMCGNDTDEAARMLEALTTFTNKEGKEIKGKTSIKALSDKHAKVTLRLAREQYDKWLAALDAPPPEPLDLEYPEEDIPY